MIALLEIMKEVLDEATYKINGRNVKARMEVSPQRRPFKIGRCLVLQRPKEIMLEKRKRNGQDGSRKRTKQKTEVQKAVMVKKRLRAKLLSAQKVIGTKP